jgi:hypothetical protein
VGDLVEVVCGTTEPIKSWLAGSGDVINNLQSPNLGPEPYLEEIPIVASPLHQW